MRHTENNLDWLACELIEQIPGKVSGQPIVRGTRILPDALVDSYDLGETLEELREGFPSLPAEQNARLIELAHQQRRQHTISLPFLQDWRQCR
jgi:uncharacterized protein (DUF433 family)